jgi:hypothetical protein
MLEIDFLNSVLQTGLMGVAVMAGVFFMMKYLQKEGPSTSLKEFKVLKEELTRIRNTMAHPQVGSSKDIEELKFQIEELRSSQSRLSENEHDDLVRRLKEKVENDASNSVLTDLKKRITEEEKERLRFEFVENQYSDTISRLKEELFSLSKRGNLNLSIGIMITIVGLGLLGMFVMSFGSPKADVSEFFIEFFPRISLVLLIEIFAFFFLSLYKSSLSEIKYFQNEVTSMESKYLALKVAMESGDAKNVTHVIEQLAKSERNFILEKGQTTVDLERVKSDQQATNDILGKVANIFGNKP